MSNIQTEINRLTQAKTDIKGVLDRLSVSYESDKLDSLALAIGSIKKVEAKQENGVITIPAGYISEEQTFVVSSDLTTGYLINGADGNVYFQAVKEVDGEIVADGEPVKVEGIEIPDTGVDAPSPVYPLPEADIVTGYVINNDGSVYFQRVKEVDGEISNDGDPVLISAANIPETGVDEPAYTCDTQGGFKLAKITEYIPYRSELTAPEKVVISGMGTVESEWGDSADFSDVNGTYTVTDDTKYLSGLKRVYKQEGGEYYLRGYDPADYEYSDYDAYWCITQYTGNSRYEAKAVFDGENIPSGTNTWYSDMLGNISIPTEVTNTAYPEQPFVLTGRIVTEITEDAVLVSEQEVSFSDFEHLPYIGGIYVTVGDTLKGRDIGVLYWQSPQNMTSNESDEGFIVDQSTSYSGDATNAYKCFDGNVSLGSYSSGTYNSMDGVEEAWISMSLIKSKKINYIRLCSAGYDNGCQPASFVLEGCNDGVSWVSILTVDGLTKSWWNTPNVGAFHEWSVEGKYQYYRLRMTAKTSGVSFNMQTIEIGYK